MLKIGLRGRMLLTLLEIHAEFSTVPYCQLILQGWEHSHDCARKGSYTLPQCSEVEQTFNLVSLQILNSLLANFRFVKSFILATNLRAAFADHVEQL